MNAYVSLPRLTRSQMAWRVAQDIPDGAYVNLGIGMPELVSQYQPAGRLVIYHSENGILGLGERAAPGAEDYDIINAGKKPVTLIPGGSIFNHADSFAMIRGGHIDISVLGAFQVAANGDIANWFRDDGDIPAVGGAMDLVTGARSVYVLMEHVTRDGALRLVERCSYPLTGAHSVTRIYTDLAVVAVTGDGFGLMEIVDGISVDELQSLTSARLTPLPGLKPLSTPTLVD